MVASINAPTNPPPFPFVGPLLVLRHGSFPNESVLSGLIAGPEEVVNPAFAAAAAKSTQDEQDGGDSEVALVVVEGEGEGDGRVDGGVELIVVAAAPSASSGGRDGFSGEGERAVSVPTTCVASLPCSMARYLLGLMWGGKECGKERMQYFFLLVPFFPSRERICPLQHWSGVIGEGWPGGAEGIGWGWQQQG